MRYIVVIIAVLLYMMEVSEGTYIVGSYTLEEFGIVEENQDSSNTGKLYCENYQPTIASDATAPTPLSIGQSYSASQNECVKFYYVLIDGSNTNNYIDIDLHITQMPYGSDPIYPLFAYKVGSPPTMTYQSSTSIAFDSVQFDFNAYYLGKRYMHFRISPDDRKVGSGNTALANLLYFGFYIFDSPPYSAQIQYVISVSADATPSCPLNCNSHGTCIEETGICNCTQGWIDEDCTTRKPPSLLPYNVNLNAITEATVVPSFPLTFTFDANSLIYLELIIPANNSDYEFTISKTSSIQLDIYTRLSTSGILYPPNYFQKSNVYRMPESLSTASIAIYQSSLSENRIVTASIINANPQSTMVSISLNPGAPTNIIIYIFIACTACLFILCIVATFTRRARIRRMQEQIIQRQHQLVQRAQAEALTQEDIDKFMPAQAFGSFSQKYDQNSCTICLDDYTPESNCRMIILCNHIFHSKCIEAWLQRDKNCPNCKIALTKTELEKWVKSKKQAQEPVKDNSSSSKEDNSSKEATLNVRGEHSENQHLNPESNNINNNSNEAAGTNEIQINLGGSDGNVDHDCEIIPSPRNLPSVEISASR